MMEDKLRQRSKMEWTEELIARGIPAGPIYNLAEVFADPQVRYCGMVEEIDHREIGSLRQVATPIRMDASGTQTCYRAPPLLGEHTREVLIECGIAPARIEALAAAGVVRQHP
jgi:crotonobetainyl-CoA:carnitine CoA-transferase CaiB-like acyl-CoA transferase